MAYLDDSCWKKPGYCKLVTRVNVQASTKMANAGGTLKDGNDGRWILCFSKKLGKVSGVEAELLALREGLQVAWERRIPKIEIEVDPLVMVEVYRADVVEGHPLRSLIKECEALLRKPWVFNRTYPTCYTNSFAYTLAERGHDLQDDFRLWEEPPLEFFIGIRQGAPLDMKPN